MTQNYSNHELSHVYTRVSRPPPYATRVDSGLSSLIMDNVQ